MVTEAPRVCNRTGCAGVGRWHPVLILRPRWWSGKGIEVAIGVVLCDECKLTAEAEHFISDEGWDMLVKSIRAMGKAAPDREVTGLAFKPAGSFDFAGGSFSPPTPG